MATCAIYLLPIIFRENFRSNTETSHLLVCTKNLPTTFSRGFRESLFLGIFRRYFLRSLREHLFVGNCLQDSDKTRVLSLWPRLLVGNFARTMIVKKISRDTWCFLIVMIQWRLKQNWYQSHIKFGSKPSRNKKKTWALTNQTAILGTRSLLL